MNERLLQLLRQVLRYEKLPKYGGLVGYPIFYLVCLLIFCSLTFPYDKLRERIVATFNGQNKPGSSAQELQIDELGGYWLSGVKMKGVRLLTASSEPGKPPSKIEIDEARVRYSLLPLLVGSSDLGFDFSAFGGTASGSYDSSGTDKAVDVQLEGIDVGQIGPLVQILGVPLQGTLGGRVRFTMPEGKSTKTSGSVSLEAKDVSVGDGKAKLKGAIALPKVDVGTLTFAGEAKEGVLKITKLVAGGKDVEVQGDGRITVRDLVSDSLCDAQLRFKINDAYRGKSEMTKTLFGSPGSNGPGLFDLADAKIRASKRPDGYYAWYMHGPLGNLDFSPAPAVGYAPGK